MKYLVFVIIVCANNLQELSYVMKRPIQKPNDTSENIEEIDLPFTTKIYKSKDDKIMIRFDNALFLHLKEQIKDQRYRDEMEDLK